MVQFEISITDEEDEPPLFDTGDSRSTPITPFISNEDDLVRALYSAPVTEYVSSPKPVVESTDVIYSVLSLDFGVANTLADELSPLEMMLDDAKTFDRAIIDYIFDPPSIENDEMAVDRELMSDNQKAMLPYLQRLQKGAIESENSTYRRLLGYNSLGSLN